MELYAEEFIVSLYDDWESVSERWWNERQFDFDRLENMGDLKLFDKSVESIAYKFTELQRNGDFYYYVFDVLFDNGESRILFVGFTPDEHGEWQLVSCGPHQSCEIRTM